MNRFLLFFFFGIVFYACQPRVIENITIQKIPIKDTSIRAIHVIDSNTVYFAGSNGKIGHTIDGGKNWIITSIKYQDSIPVHFRSIARNNNNIFALSIANPALLYKINKKNIQLVYKETHKNVFYDALKFFPNGKNGIAVGDPTENCPSIITTSNGGNTWTKIPCENLPVFKDGEAFFAASNTNIKIINNTVWIASGWKKARILKSEDTGKTWQIFNTPIIQGENTQGIYSIDFADINNGIIIGGDYSKPLENNKNKAITKDGGLTWTLVANNLNPSYKSCVQYVPNTNGKEVFAVGKTGVSYSNNKGISWKKISKDSYYTIQFIDKNTAWLSGHEKIGKLKLPY